MSCEAFDWDSLQEEEVATGVAGNPAPMWSAARSNKFAKNNRKNLLADRMSNDSAGGAGDDGPGPEWIYDVRTMKEAEITPFKADQPFFAICKQVDPEKPHVFDHELVNCKGESVFSVTKATFNYYNVVKEHWMGEEKSSDPRFAR
eukprot:gnl/MRDRNA2_/MRDRNA2_19643_c0_seq1.p1 gnl/MRDRNA2_/MRDRNA2_19643_c0~~gnl/MRDRNA2_/MRDRNA2_19643_c0_seq1.p1  ORF type:complete len:146 (+),score=40.67 gnl/MRDRNA2_/MRDRNA2_19643_c0_seq1:80-517(+)